MRVWTYHIDHSTRRWILQVFPHCLDDDCTGVIVLEAAFNHRAKPGIEVYARFIVDACNAAEEAAVDEAQAAEDRRIDGFRYARLMDSSKG